MAPHSKPPLQLKHLRNTDIVFGYFDGQYDYSGIAGQFDYHDPDKALKLVILAFLANDRKDAFEGWQFVGWNDADTLKSQLGIPYEVVVRLCEELTAESCCYVERRGHPNEETFTQYRFDRPRYDQDCKRAEAALKAQMDADFLEAHKGADPENCPRHRALLDTMQKEPIQ